MKSYTTEELKLKAEEFLSAKFLWELEKTNYKLAFQRFITYLETQGAEENAVDLSLECCDLGYGGYVPLPNTGAVLIRDFDQDYGC
jgi:hypothetical protein